jgi:hypothetical protein
MGLGRTPRKTSIILHVRIVEGVMEFLDKSGGDSSANKCVGLCRRLMMMLLAPLYHR